MFPWEVARHEAFDILVRGAIELIMLSKGYKPISANEAEIIIGHSLRMRDKDDPDLHWFRALYAHKGKWDRANLNAIDQAR